MQTEGKVMKHKSEISLKGFLTFVYEAAMLQFKLFVPQRRNMCFTVEGISIPSTLYRIAYTVSPAMPAFNTVESGKYSK